MDARDVILNELVKARNDCKNCRNSVQVFLTAERSSLQSYSRDDFQYLSNGEQLNILEAAIENAKAFMMSDITVEDVNKRTGSSSPLTVQCCMAYNQGQPHIFNAAKNKVPTVLRR